MYSSIKAFQITIISLIVLAIIASPIIAYNTDEIISTCIEDKERVVSGSGEDTSSKYLIFTEEETFENSDTIWYLKFSSSDIYGELKRGECYDMRVYGFRVPFLSWYRNIINISN